MNWSARQLHTPWRAVDVPKIPKAKKRWQLSKTKLLKALRNQLLIQLLQVQQQDLGLVRAEKLSKTKCAQLGYKRKVRNGTLSAGRRP